METWSIVNNRCIVHRACRFLAVTRASDAQELCATPGQGGGGWQRCWLRPLSTGLFPGSSPCADGDLRLGVLSVVAWGPDTGIQLGLDPRLLPYWKRGVLAA